MVAINSNRFFIGRQDFNFLSPQGILSSGTQASPQKEIFSAKEAIRTPLNPYYLHLWSVSNAQRMLSELEEKRFLSKSKIFNSATPKEILEELLIETILNGVESAARKYEPNGCIGAELEVKALLGDGKLHLEIIDNGSGFPEGLLPLVGQRSLMDMKKDSVKKPDIDKGIKDHLYKMGSLCRLLGWELQAKNRTDTSGAVVSIIVS